MSWYFPEDRTKPVFTAEEHLRSKHRGGEADALPKKAVLFCLGKGLPILEANFPTETLLDALPGFITHSKVLGVPGHEEVCFLHGGYGSPQMACTAETLRALGVDQFFLVGLCGIFREDLRVGDLLLPEQIRCEEGASLHYREDPGFVPVNSPVNPARLSAFFAERGLTVKRENTVTTDAVYRQTYRKEALWRELSCAGVDMEASALATLCEYYGMKSTILLMASDKHPIQEGDPPWEWGREDFPRLVERFVTACVEFNLEES